MLKERNNLSKTEWSIMKICWAMGKSTTKKVYEESLKDKKREYSTIATMLDRLLKKGFLKREKFGPVWVYEPTNSKPKVISRAIDSFVDTVLDHGAVPLFTHFFKKEKLSSEEIEALEELIKKKKGE